MPIAMEANAAMKRPVPRDRGESYQEMPVRLAEAKRRQDAGPGRACGL